MDRTSDNTAVTPEDTDRDAHEKMRRRFQRRGGFLSADEDELIAEAARHCPGEKILQGLRLSQVFLQEHN